MFFNNTLFIFLTDVFDVLLLHPNFFFSKIRLIVNLFHLISRHLHFIFQHCVHHRENLNVKNIFNDVPALSNRETHERNEGTTSQYHNLSERFVVHLEDVSLKLFLIIVCRAGLIKHLTVLVDLKDTRLDTTNNFEVVLCNTELDLNHAILLIDAIHQHRFVDLTKWFPKEGKCECV